MITRILQRAKKLITLLILLPLLSAGFSYFFTSKDTEPEYKATSLILLGNFENEKRTNVHVMKTLLASTRYWNDVNESFQLGLDVNQVKASLNVVANQQDKTITLEITGTDQAEVEKLISDVTDAVMLEGKELYDSKVELLNSKVAAINANDSEYEPTTKHYVLSQLEMTLIDIEESVVLELTDASSAEPISIMDKIVIGFLLGLILDFFILFAPELFREEKLHK